MPDMEVDRTEAIASGLVPPKLHQWLESNRADLSDISSQPQAEEEYASIVRNAEKWGGGKLESFLGEGMMGQAWLLSNGTVIKFTTDKHEAGASNKLVGLRIPGVVRIFDVRRVNDHELFVVHQEHLKGPTLDKANVPQRLKDEVKKFHWEVNSTAEALRLTRSSRNPYLVQLYDILRRLVKAGVEWFDFKPNNMVVQNGRITVFDFGASQFRPKPIRKLSLEHKLNIAFIRTLICQH